MLRIVEMDDTGDYKKVCGRRLRAVRVALHHETIRAFAKATGVEEDTLGSWESGKNMVQHYYVQRLKERYSITFDWIYAEDPSGLPQRLGGLLSEEDLHIEIGDAHPLPKKAS